MASAIERLSGKGGKIGDVKTRKDYFKLQEEVEFIDLSDGELHQVRILPGIFAFGQHWLDIEVKKDGGKAKTVRIPKPCHNLDMRTGTFDSGIVDPIHANKEYFSSNGNEGSTGFALHYYMNVIDRELQENEPRKPKAPSKDEKKDGFKRKGTDSYTPVRVLRIPKGAVEKIQKLAARNIKKDKKGGKTQYDLGDLKYGRDILVSFDTDAAPANKWDIQLSDDPMTALKDEELNYLIYDLESLIKKAQSQETIEETQKWVDQYIQEFDNEDDSDDDENDDDDYEDDRRSSKSKKSKSKAKSGKSKSKDEDEDDDDDLDLDLDLDDDEDDDEDDKASKKKSSKSKGKSKSSKSDKVDKSSKKKSKKPKR